MEFLVIVICVCIILLFGLVANEFYKIACLKGYEDKKYFWLSFLLTIIGYLLVIALPTKSTPVDYNQENDDLPEI